jgi:hypothetical protein
MPNGYHINEASGIEDLIHDPVFSNSNPPEIPCTSQLATPRWPWGPGQGLDARKDSAYDVRIEEFNLFASGAGKTDTVFTHSGSAFRFAVASVEH